jgi:protein-L-isoaspartate O-methyltransferase
MANTCISHPLFARLFALLAPTAEGLGVAAHREELLEGLCGKVIEVGAGSGLNFAHYPSTVTEVLAVEPDPYLRARATEAASNARIPVQVVDGTAEELPVGDGPFDVAVASFVVA